MSDNHVGYEFLDHTADVQIRAWGKNIEEAFENGAIAMTAYITDLDKVEITTKETIQVEASDLYGLLYRFLDSVSFLFNAEPYLLSKKVKITQFKANKTSEEFKIEAECYGEPFDMRKHPQGTEIKAITYSNMQIYDESQKHEVLFIVDI